MTTRRKVSREPEGGRDLRSMERDRGDVNAGAGGPRRDAAALCGRSSSGSTARVDQNHVRQARNRGAGECCSHSCATVPPCASSDGSRLRRFSSLETAAVTALELGHQAGLSRRHAAVGYAELVIAREADEVDKSTRRRQHAPHSRLATGFTVSLCPWNVCGP